MCDRGDAPPTAAVEAFFVAAVLLIDLEAEFAEGGPVEMRYFTLAKGVTFEGGPPRTVLCEWGPEMSHSNYGDGPEPRVEAFVARLEEKLAAEA